MKAKRFNLVVKGDVAFAYALDENGRRVAAIDAIPGKKYYCPCCGIPMHRQTRGETVYFAKYPGTTHRKLSCRKLETLQVRRVFPKNTEPVKFVGRFTRESFERRPKTPGPKPIPPEGEDDPEEDPDNQNKEPEELIFSSLKQIAESDIITHDPYEKCGDYRLIDYIVPYPCMQEILAKSKELGARIIWAAPQFYDSESKSIIFRVFNYSKAEGKLLSQAKFCLSFNRVDDYKKVLKSAMRPERDSGNDKMKKFHTSALIASTNWEPLQRERCYSYCKRHNMAECRTCDGMHNAEYSSQKQIYLFSED